MSYPGLTGYTFPIPCKSGVGDGKTWPRPSPSSICIVGLAAVVPISSVLDLEMELIADGV